MMGAAGSESLAGSPAPRFGRWAPWAAVLVTVLALGAVVTHTFAPIDDDSTIWNNPRLNPPRFTADGVLWYWGHAEHGLYVPLTYTVWGLVAKATWAPKTNVGPNLSPGVFHAASLAAHAAAVLGAYAVLHLLLRRKHPWAAAAGALVYGVHPLQVEAVAWTSGLKDVLSGALALVALWLYLRAAEQADAERAAEERAQADRAEARRKQAAESPPAAGGEALFPWTAGQRGPATPPARRWVRAYAAGLACFLLAMLAKPSAVVVPVLAAAIDLLVLRRPARRVGAFVAPWAALAVPLAAVARMAQPGEGIAPVAPWDRPVVAGASLAFYLWKLVLPTGLAFDYGWRPAVMLAQGWFRAIALVSPAVLGAAVAAIAWAGRRSGAETGAAPRGRAAWGWPAAAAFVFVAALLPVLGLLPFMFQRYSTVADHYAYLAMLGPAMLVAWGVARLGGLGERGGDARAWGRRRFVAGAAVAVLALLAGLSVATLRHWRTEETVLRRTLAVNPRSVLGHNGLGLILHDRGDAAGAEREFRAAVEADPDAVSARRNLVRLYISTHRPDDAIREAYGLFKANRARPESQRADYSTLFYDAGAAMMARGRPADAERYFAEAVRYRPHDARAAAGLREAQAAQRK